MTWPELANAFQSLYLRSTRQEQISKFWTLWTFFTYKLRLFLWNSSTVGAGRSRVRARQIRRQEDHRTHCLAGWLCVFLFIFDYVWLFSIAIRSFGSGWRKRFARFDSQSTSAICSALVWSLVSWKRNHFFKTAFLIEK